MSTNYLVTEQAVYPIGKKEKALAFFKVCEIQTGADLFNLLPTDISLAHFFLINQDQALLLDLAVSDAGFEEVIENVLQQRFECDLSQIKLGEAKVHDFKPQATLDEIKSNLF
ncbi:hypothetical protein [Vagococcus sp.]|uniref:hypothetical protein n=1 Tax=Vagococcus sp. TaxID=1933889 RepID=UPI003F9E410B